jgi:hypothetical protein
VIFKPVSFRPAFGRVLTIVVAVITGVALAGFVVSGDLVGLLRYGWVPLFVFALTWALFWAPKLDVQEHEVTVRNVFRTVHLPWPAIQRIDTKYALTLDTSIGRVPVWAAPAPSRYSVMNVTSEDTKRVAESARAASGSIRPGDALNSASGVAAHSMRLRWQQLRDEGFLDSAVIEPGSLRVQWHWGTAALLAVLLVGAVLGTVL